MKKLKKTGKVAANTSSIEDFECNE